jgi:hypothetical protein
VILGAGARVDWIESTGNAGNGISTGDEALITDSAAKGNGNYGLITGSQSVLKNCQSISNELGILMLEQSRAEGCVACKNIEPGFTYFWGCSLSDCVGDGNGAGFVASSLAKGCTLNHCIGSTNNGYGFQSNGQTVFIGCIATGNKNGFYVATGGGAYAASFTDCTATDNGAPGLAGFGFSCGIGAKVEGCIAFGNSGTGIVSGQASFITGCEVRNNALDGILVPNDCCVARNHVSGNGTAAGPVAGIRVTSDGNRIVDNSIIFNNDTGLKVNGISNLITGNSSRFHGTKNFVIAAGNRYGEIVDLTGTAGVAAVSSNAAASTLGGVASALANFAY